MKDGMQYRKKQIKKEEIMEARNNNWQKEGNTDRKKQSQKEERNERTKGTQHETGHVEIEILTR